MLKNLNSWLLSIQYRRHRRRSSPSAKSSELSRCDWWLGPAILHLLGKRRSAIAIVAAAVGADAVADAGADVRSRVVVVVAIVVVVVLVVIVAPAIPLPSP
jgi:hypothetical protein